MRMLFMAADEGGSGYHRIYKMAKYLGESGKHQTQYVYLPDQSVLGESWDMVVMQRQVSKTAEKVIQFLHKSGTCVVYELDDNIWELPKGNYTGIWWTPESLAGAEKVIKACDAVVVSTQPLADYMLRFHKNITVIPNYVQHIGTIKRNHEKLRIGYMGSASHVVDFTTDIIRTLLKIKEDSGCELVFVGYIPEQLKGKVRYISYVHPNQYLQKLNELSIDIGIIPCADVSFNKYKSLLKLLDYGICGIPAVVFNQPPYRDCNITFQAVDDVQGMYETIINLISDVQLRHHLSFETQKETASKYTMEVNIDSISKAYQNIFDNFRQERCH